MTERAVVTRNDPSDQRENVAAHGPDTSQRNGVVVVLASAGRPELLGEVLEDLTRQTLSHTVVVSVPDAESLPSGADPSSYRRATARGLAAQRNAGLDAAPDEEFVFFFDDDSVMREDYLERGVAYFRENPTVAAITGRVLLDGATTDAVERTTAQEALRESADEPLRGTGSRSRELYGCNFAFRRSMVVGERFDDRLPLYSWLEDHDFARRAMWHGELAKVHDCVIVHRGVKSGGRTAHRRLGYSQIMNPVHLLRTGSFPLWLTLLETLPRSGKNIVGSVAGPDAGWRRERLSGNVLALADVLRGRLTPERAIEL